MKRLFKLFLLLIFLSLFVLAGLVMLSIQDHPLVATGVKLTPAEVERARQLVQEHDPREAREGEVKSISLSEAELNLIGNYLAYTLGGGAVVGVSEGSMDIARHRQGAQISLRRVPQCQHRFA